MKYFRKILLLSPILLIVLIVNIVGDVNQEFLKIEKLKEVVDVNVSGQDALTNMAEVCNRRQYVKLRVAHCENVDTVIVGSSKVGLINEHVLETNNFVNNYVGYAVLEDYMAIFNLYAENKIPRRVIIGVDPWIFNANNADAGPKQTEFWDYEADKWLSRIGYHSLMFESARQEIGRYKYLMDMFSLSYFQDSLKHVFENVYVVPATGANKDVVYQHATMEVDLLDENNWDDEISADSILKDIALEGKAKFNDFHCLDDTKVKMFEKSVEHLINEGVEVQIVLPPFHPVAYDWIEENCPVVCDCEQYLISFCKKNGLECVGSYNSRMMGIDGKCFYDAMHLRSVNAYKSVFEMERVSGEKEGK